MTAPEPMSRKELIELAALDALGLLDEYESALYSRSFHHASAAVQDHIRELQAEVATHMASLCKDEPTPALRDRVLQAVAEAIEQDSPAPLASIGRVLQERDEFEAAAANDSARATYNPRRLTLSGQFWRAASFVLLGVVAVVVYNLLEARNFNQQLIMTALSDNTRQQLELIIGPTVKEYLQSPNTTRIVLTADNEQCGCWANLLVLEGESKAMLITEGLPNLSAGVTYQLRFRESNGIVQTIANFTAGEMLEGRRVFIDSPSLMAATTWEIAGPDGIMLTGGRA